MECVNQIACEPDDYTILLDDVSDEDDDNDSY